MNLLEGKKGLIFGVANDRSIGWGIARVFHENGAEMAFSYVNDSIKKRVEPLAQSLGKKSPLFQYEAGSSESLSGSVEFAKKTFGEIDFIIHSIAFAQREFLTGKYFEVTRHGFLEAMDISVFSFTEMAKEFYPILKTGGSLLTLTYLGAERVVPNYNIMGVAKAALENSVGYLARDMGDKNIRVNAISAGILKTLASSAIPGVKDKMKATEEHALLKRNVTTEEVGKAALFLCSDLGSGVTGEILHVDAGFNKVVS